MLQVLKNAFDIHVLTAINHSEADWNIQRLLNLGIHRLFWKSEDAFDVCFRCMKGIFGRKYAQNVH